MTLVRYTKANAPAGVAPTVDWSGGTFNVRAALVSGGGAFTVDDATQANLITALDGYPGVQRSGGGGGAGGGSSSPQISSLAYAELLSLPWAATILGNTDVPGLTTGVVVVPASGLMAVDLCLSYLGSATAGTTIAAVVQEAPVSAGVPGTYNVLGSATGWATAVNANQGAPLRVGGRLVRTPGAQYVYKVTVSTLAGTGFAKLWQPGWLEIVAR